MAYHSTCAFFAVIYWFVLTNLSSINGSIGRGEIGWLPNFMVARREKKKTWKQGKRRHAEVSSQAEGKPRHAEVSSQAEGKPRHAEVSSQAEGKRRHAEVSSQAEGKPRVSNGRQREAHSISHVSVSDPTRRFPCYFGKHLNKEREGWRGGGVFLPEVWA